MTRGGQVEPATSTFEAVVIAGGQRVAELMARAEHELVASCGDYGEELTGHALSTLSAGGKRLRPLLVFLCGTPSSDEQLVRVATAVELVHMATLVHDDAVDAAPLRRGEPTVFARAGREAAVATGDFLLSRALQVIATNGEAAQTRVLADACLALSQGEFAQRHDAFRGDVTVERYLYRCELKTARLFSAACALGAMASGREAAEVGSLEEFGAKVGLAFQMLDDVLDISGPAERTGKRRGTDLLEGTTTLPAILAGEVEPSLAGLDLREVTTAEQAEAICDRIAATGSLETARDRATGLVAEAKQGVAGTVDSELDSALAMVADGIVSRYA
jgi:geranylgeranyl pyrophosphate synthase